MCQVEEDYRGFEEHEAASRNDKKCAKCKDAIAALVVRADDTYCRDCFHSYFIHKFRAMLGKNRVIFPAEKVLLAVSGGPSSCSMLNQVQQGLCQNAHKKLRFLPGIVYVDDGGALGQSLKERQRIVEELQVMFRATGFPFHVVPLEQVLDLPASVVEARPSLSHQPASDYKAAVDHFIQSVSSSGSTPQRRDQTFTPDVPTSKTLLLQQMIGSAKTQTAKEDLLNTLRHHLLVHTARKEGYSKLMLGENCTRLAVKLLSNISLGRGAQLAQDTGFSDSRYGDIILVRPMRDYSAKEIAYFNHMFDVPSVSTPSLEMQVKEKGSIQQLTETFVTKLQADFPSTVSTIYRTSDKLQTVCQSSSGADQHTRRCLLCMCSLDTTVENASAFQATIVSEQLSQNMSGCANSETRPKESPAQTDNFPGQCLSGEEVDCGRTAGRGSCCSSVKVTSTPDLCSHLCYSCQLTVKDMSSVDCLPPYILSEAQRRKMRSQMREEISEFLLDNGIEGDS